MRRFLIAVMAILLCASCASLSEIQKEKVLSILKTAGKAAAAQYIDEKVAEGDIEPAHAEVLKAVVDTVE